MSGAPPVREEEVPVVWRRFLYGRAARSADGQLRAEITWWRRPRTRRAHLRQQAKVTAIRDSPADGGPGIRVTGTARSALYRFLPLTCGWYLLVLVGVLVLALRGGAVTTVAAGLTGIGVVTAWQRLLRLYLPSSSAVRREPTIRELAQRLREENRRWCGVATFAQMLLVPCAVFTLIAMRRPVEALAAGFAQTGVLGAWWIVLRHYFPAVAPPPNWGQGHEPHVAGLLRAERTRRTYLAATLVLFLAVFGGVFLLAIWNLPAEAFTAGVAGTACITGWRIILRHYFPPIERGCADGPERSAGTGGDDTGGDDTDGCVVA
jgi:hypothetical protein